MSIIYARKAQNELCGHLIEFGWFNWSAIADDCTKCFVIFANAFRPWISNKLCIVNIIYAKKRAKAQVYDP